MVLVLKHLKKSIWREGSKFRSIVQIVGTIKVVKTALSAKKMKNVILKKIFYHKGLTNPHFSDNMYMQG